jgi:hypothetical protein
MLYSSPNQILQPLPVPLSTQAQPTHKSRRVTKQEDGFAKNSLFESQLGGAKFMSDENSKHKTAHKMQASPKKEESLVK